MEFTDEELKMIHYWYKVTAMKTMEISELADSLQYKILDEIEKRKELAELDFECSSCKL